MTLAALRKADPKVARTYELFRSGKSQSAVARALGVYQSTVGYRLAKARLLLAGVEPQRSGHDIDWTKVEERLTKYGRCSECHLLKPCLCEQARLERASSRGGPGAEYPESGAW